MLFGTKYHFTIKPDEEKRVGKMPETVLEDYCIWANSLMDIIESLKEEETAKLQEYAGERYDGLCALLKNDRGYTMVARIFHAFKMDMRTMVLLIIGICLEVDTGFGARFRRYYNILTADFSAAMNLASVCVEIDTDYIGQLCQEGNAIWYFFAEEFRQESIFWAQPFVLRREVLGWILTGDIHADYLETDSNDGYELQEVRGKGQRTAAYGKAVAEITKSLDNDCRNKNLFLIYGKSEDEDKEVLREIVHGRNSRLVLIDGMLLFEDRFRESREYAGGRLRECIAAIVLSGEYVCFYHLNPENIPVFMWYNALLKKYQIKVFCLMGDIRDVRDTGLKQLEKEAIRIVEMEGVCGHTAFGTFINTAESLEDYVGTKEIVQMLGLILYHARNNSRLAAVKERNTNASASSLAVLLHGASGTGKTMLAGVIAKELGRPLLKADVSQISDKYIGETEKHLEELFTAAQRSGSVLFFDEADILFAKRTQISSSHDKYSNVSAAYLLQKMDSFGGVVVMATNLLNNFDEAFLRRIQYILKLPIPDADIRKRVWEKLLRRMDCFENTDIDCMALAERYKISPARIKNVVWNAYVISQYEQSSAIGMKHIKKALRCELQKEGRPLLESQEMRE